MKLHLGAKLLLIAAPAAVFGQTPKAPAKPAAPAATAAPVAPALKLESLNGKPDPNKVILVVGTEKMTQADLDKLMSSMGDQLKMAMSRPEGRKQIAEQLVQMKLLAQQAQKENLQNRPEVADQLAFQRENLLARAYFQELLKNAKVDDAAVQKYYGEHKGDYEQAKAKHILIRFKGSQVPLKPTQKDLTKEEALAKAQDLRKQLLAGADFAKLAQENSDDTGSGASGGELGSFGHHQMVPPFDQAVFSQPVGKVGEPVETPFGYHLIVVESREVKPLAEVRPEIENRMRPDMAKQALEDLRKKTNVVIDESVFGGAAEK